MKYHWFVCYQWGSEVNKFGFGSIEISTDEEVFVPSEISGFIGDKTGLRKVVLINWKKLEPNQLCVNSSLS